MKNRAQAFTLVELLVVITIIAVLVGLLFPVVGSVRDNARKAVARANLSGIVIALNQYRTDYGLFPPEDMQAEGAESNAEIITVLRGAEEEPEFNPRKVKYLQVKDAKPMGKAGFADGVTTEGDYVDPWTFAYGLKWDSDYDGTIDLPTGVTTDAGKTTVDSDAITWSVGKNGELGDSDDVNSWE